jgi:hypothetical protein
MNEETETRQYCVTVKLYTWAVDEPEALNNVIDDLSYLCKSHDDNYIIGFIHPELPDVVEDKEA